MASVEAKGTTDPPFSVSSEQRIADDIASFCDKAVGLFCTIFVSFCDLAVFSVILYKVHN